MAKTDFKPATSTSLKHSNDLRGEMPESRNPPNAIIPESQNPPPHPNSEFTISILSKRFSAVHAQSSDFGGRRHRRQPANYAISEFLGSPGHVPVWYDGISYGFCCLLTTWTAKLSTDLSMQADHGHWTLAWRQGTPVIVTQLKFEPKIQLWARWMTSNKRK